MASSCWSSCTVGTLSSLSASEPGLWFWRCGFLQLVANAYATVCIVRHRLMLCAVEIGAIEATDNVLLLLRDFPQQVWLVVYWASYGQCRDWLNRPLATKVARSSVLECQELNHGFHCGKYIWYRFGLCNELLYGLSLLNWFAILYKVPKNWLCGLQFDLYDITLWFLMLTFNIA